MVERPISRSRSSKKRSDAKQAGKRIRLNNLSIRNFKAFEDFSIDFPPPRMKDDPDILVIGSSNGVGKTSVLEACSLLYLATIPEGQLLDLRHFPRIGVDLSDLLIRSGAEEAIIEGTFAVGDQNIHGNLTLYRSGGISVDRDEREPLQSDGVFIQPLLRQSDNDEIVTKLFLSLVGMSNDPLLLPPFMYFHSYRKIQEGRLELGKLVAGGSYRRGMGAPMTTFKFEILRALMSREGLFEDFDAVEAKEVLETLDRLMKEYAHVAIGKLKLLPDSTIDLRVIPGNSDSGLSYSFDSLSSGQKEMISTLFLIGRYGQKDPGIVLIDEPELHLNAEWHRRLIRQMCQLAPGNQYIIATHSEDIVDAVDKDRRRLLVPKKEES